MGKKTFYKSSEGKNRIQDHYEKYLLTLPFSVERAFVETSFGKTHVLVAGPKDGKPLFIFQGGNCINPMTLSWFIPLAQTYRIYAPDTIGHPGFSDENRISAKDQSFASWIEELMDFFQIKTSAFLGPSYGGGIILRLATFKPEKIDCAILVSTAGLKLGSKLDMINRILIPMMMFNMTKSQKHLGKIANVMSFNSMKEMDKQIIGDIFTYTKIEQEMPKMTTKEELVNYQSPTLLISGEKDIFFPSKHLTEAAPLIPNLVEHVTFDMGHFPDQDHLIKINDTILDFLQANYEGDSSFPSAQKPTNGLIL